MMAMLRSVKFIEKIVFHSRSIVTNASYQRNYGGIFKCSYSTQRVQQLLGNERRTEGSDLTNVLNRIRKREVTSQEAFDILKMCGSEETLHTELIDEIWATLKDKVTLNISHYNALLKSYIDTEKDFKPEEIMQEILDAGIEPNRATFNYLIRAFALQGNVNGVVGTLEEMNKNHMPVNLFTYNNLLLAFAKNGNLERMHEVEKLLLEKGFKPQSDTLSALLTGYAKTGRIEDITRTFDRFSELKIVLLNKDVLDVIFDLYVNGHHGEIEAVSGRLYESPEFDMSLKLFVEKAMRHGVEGIVPKLLATFDEADRITLAKSYLAALSEASAQQIDEAVKALEGHGITLQTQPSVFEIGLQSNSIELIRAILDDRKTNSLSIETKHFWKLIQLESANGTDAVLNVLHSMRKEFNVELDSQTIREVALPSLNVAADPFLAFARLRTVDSNQFKIARCVIQRCLLDKNMKAAFEIANDFKTCHFNMKYFKNILIDAYLATDDNLHYVKIINVFQFGLSEHRVDSGDQPEASEPDDVLGHATTPTISTNQGIFIGTMLRETIGHLQTEPQRIESLLRAFVREGLIISPQFADKIKNDFRDKLNQKSCKLLDTLSSGKLEPASLGLDEKRRRSLDLLSSNELKKMIEFKEEKEDPVGLKKLLFNAYVKEKNLAEVEELSKTLNLSLGDHQKVIDLMIEMSSADEVLNYLDEVHKTTPDFVLRRKQADKLASAMFKANHEWSKIICIFTENKQEPLRNQNWDGSLQFLQDVADSGNAEQLSELSTVLIENNYMGKRVRIGHLFINVHLKNNDLPEAVRTFEKQCEEKNEVAGRGALMKALIKAHEMDTLQRVFDILASKRSETFAAMSLARSFIELGNLLQARLVLKNMKNSRHNLNDEFRRTCDQFHKMGRYDLLEGLLEASDELQYDRTDIYNYLLMHYCNENKTQEALELWHKQQDCDEKPSKLFLQKLASHLHENGIEVPFTVPEKRAEPNRRAAEQPIHARTAAKAKPSRAVAPKASPIKSPEITLKELLRQENADAETSINMWRKIDSSSAEYPYLTSALVRLLTKSSRFAEALDIVTQATESGTVVKKSALRDLTRPIAEDGDVQMLYRLEDVLPIQVQRDIRLANDILKAYEKTGKWDEFFHRIVEKSERGDTAEEMNSRISMKHLLTLLQTQVIPLNKFEEFAEQVAEKGVWQPLNVLWAQYFLTDSPKSDKIYDVLEKDFPEKMRISFLVQYLSKNKDEEKLQQLLGFVGTKNENLRSAVNIAILQDHVKNKRIEDALAMIENGTLTVQQLSDRTLTQLKVRILANGDNVPPSILQSKDK